MKKILLTTLFCFSLSLTFSNSVYADDGSLLGEIELFTGNFAPAGFSFCEGQLLNIVDNQALYSILGTTYGGDGRKTFALPNLKQAEKSLNGPRYIISLYGDYPHRVLQGASGVRSSNDGQNVIVGTTTIFAGNFAPEGFAFAEGQILQIKNNEMLYSLLGNKYGGDGRETFALPNLKKAEKSLNGARYIIALKGLYPSRQ